MVMTDVKSYSVDTEEERVIIEKKMIGDSLMSKYVDRDG